jgi:2-alkyl-3-oxoalkanoate reductase
MKIFIAGATGAIGKPLIAALHARHHEIFAMTISKEKAEEMIRLGVNPVIADALDAEAVLQGMQKAKPDVVIDMLTSLPKVYTPQAMKEAAEGNRRLRREGGSYLQRAAILSNARRYILQSTAFWYEPGLGLATEETSLAFEASPGVAAGCRVYEEIENRVLHEKGLEGIVLRFGFFYGPGTWYALDGNMADQVRARNYYMVGGGHGVWNFVHVEDAAQGIVSAIQGVPGIYNITGDIPLELAVWLPAYARWLGAPLPPERTAAEEEAINGPDSVYYATRLRGASNAKARRILGFSPRVLEWISKNN